MTTKELFPKILSRIIDRGCETLEKRVESGLGGKYRDFLRQIDNNNSPQKSLLTPKAKR